MRVAIGGVRGAPVTRALLVLLVLSTMGSVAAIVMISVGEDISMMPLVFGSLIATTAFLCLYLLLPPMASRAGVEAERAWVASLPFVLEHYFDVIAAQPDAECRLHVQLEWSTRAVDGRTLQGVIALFDTQSSVTEAGGTRATFSTGPISGSTGIRVNRSNVYRNHRLSKAVHRLVDVVLMPIHRDAPLARVKLSRSY
ncbi:MAG: hypothetical protein ACXWUG_15975 [Polyangiales bacterium]